MKYLCTLPRYDKWWYVRYYSIPNIICTFLMFDENSIFTLKSATKKNTSEITCLFIFSFFNFLSLLRGRRKSRREDIVESHCFFPAPHSFFFFNLKHRALVFFWKSPYFIMNILYPGWPLSPVMARQHTQATAVHSNYSNWSDWPCKGLVTQISK